MKKQLLNITKYSALTIAMLSSTTQAVSFSKDGYTLDVSGIIGGYYTQTDCKRDSTSAAWSAFSACMYGIGASDGEDVSSVQNGYLPGWINFITTHTTDSGLDLKAHFGFAPGTSNPGDFGGRAAVNQGVGDVRNVYLSISNENGTLLLGRNAGLFQYNGTLSDITVPGVGTQAETAGAFNTTFGAVATGYTYMSFMPQITYTTPNMDGLQASIGIFQPLAISGHTVGATPYTVTDTPMIQGSVSYDIEGGSKLWASFVTQDASHTKSQGGKEVTATGFEIGGRFVVGDFTANLSGFKGDGLGDGVMFVGALDAAGNEIETEGYLANIAYKFGANKLSAQYGVTKNNDIDGAENESVSIVYLRDVSKSLNFVLEYTAQTTSQTGFSDAEANTISTGMIWFF